MVLRRLSPTIELRLPRPAKEPPAGADWIHEIKHDGFRILARQNANGVRLFTRNGYNFIAAPAPVFLMGVAHSKPASR
jgi:ATP-dependent DNA ligase